MQKCSAILAGAPDEHSVGAVPRFTYLAIPFVVYSSHPIG